MKLVRHSFWLLASMSALGWLSLAQAGSLSDSLSVNGSFDAIVASAGTEYQTLVNEQSGRAEVIWGGCDGCAGQSSRISFDGFSLPGQANNGFSDFSEPFAIGKLRFHNGTGPGDTGILSGSLGVSLLLDGYATSPFDFIFDLALTEVAPTDSARKKGGDLLTLTAQWTSLVFSTEAGSYQLNLLGWSQDGGKSFIDSLTVGDFSIDTLKLYASITPTAVPVPAAVWLFGSGLLGLMAVGRRR